MSIQLGSTEINKIYLGSTEIKKALLGSTVVYDKTGGGGHTPHSSCRGWYDAYDAATITHSGGSVSQWDDKSGYGNHATQGTGSLQPTTGTRSQNSLNVIDFDNRTEELNLPSGLYGTPLVDNNTCIIVGKFDILNSTQYLIRNGTTVRWAIGITSSQWYTRMGTAALISASGSNTNAHIFVMRRTGGTVEFYVDGSLIGTQTGNTDPPTSTAMVLGSLLDGWLGEVMIFHDSLSATDLNTECNYLETKWGLTWSDL